MLNTDLNIHDTKYMTELVLVISTAICLQRHQMEHCEICIFFYLYIKLCNIIKKKNVKKVKASVRMKEGFCESSLTLSHLRSILQENDLQVTPLLGMRQ